MGQQDFGQLSAPFGGKHVEQEQFGHKRPHKSSAELVLIPHRLGGLVGIQIRLGFLQLLIPQVQRAQLVGRPMEQRAQGASRNQKPRAGKVLGLTVQGHRFGAFGHDDRRMHPEPNHRRPKHVPTTWQPALRVSERYFVSGIGAVIGFRRAKSVN